MKINKQILVAVLGLGIAVSAQADTWINSSPTDVGVVAGQTGSTTFTFTDYSDAAATIPKPISPFSVVSVTPDLPSIFTSITDVASLVGNNGYKVVVSWTISGTVPPPSTDFLTTTILAGPSGSLQREAASTEYDVSAAPEPAQTVAGAMLLGCGGLVFAGRRLFTKKSA
jgi:hypothetical protein